MVQDYPARQMDRGELKDQPFCQQRGKDVGKHKGRTWGKCHSDSRKGTPLLSDMFLLSSLAWDEQSNLRNMRGKQKRLCDPAALGGVRAEVGDDHHTHILLGEILQTSLSLRQEELAG